MSHLAHTVALRASGVDMFFGTPENQVVALQQADFEARRGELIMLVGPSGCGKTTLLSVIAGTLTPQAGTVEVFGQRLDGLGQEELTAFRRKHLGFVFQSFNLIPTLTVMENVMVPLLIQGRPYDEAHARTLAIVLPSLLQVQRTLQRDNTSPEQVQAILNAQLAREERLRHADDVVVNDRDLAALHEQIDRLHHFYLTLRGGQP